MALRMPEATTATAPLVRSISTSEVCRSCGGLPSHGQLQSAPTLTTACVPEGATRIERQACALCIEEGNEEGNQEGNGEGDWEGD